MALNCKPNKKRKSDSDVIFEVNEGDCSPPSSPESTTNDDNTKCETNSLQTFRTDAKIFQIDEEFRSFSPQIETNKEDKKNDENIKEENLTVTDSTQSIETQKKILFSVKFFDENFARIHKTKLIGAIMGLFDYELRNETVHSTCETNFWEDTAPSDMDIVNEDSENDSEKKDNLESFFIVDTTPNCKPKLDGTPRYVPTNKFGAIEEKIDKNVTDKVQESKFVANCFNCNGNHNLKDCKEPRDHRRIQMARNNFKNKNCFKTT